MEHELPELGGIRGLIRELWTDGEIKIAALTLKTGDDYGFDGSIPNKLANLSVPNRTVASRVRSFQLQQYTGVDLAALALASDNFCGNGNAMKINGKSMNMQRIDETVNKGDTEIWRVSVDDWRHPFHIHGCSFRILSQEGAQPPAYAQGWKDMVNVDGEKWSEVLVSFNHYAPKDTPYMYHCHILEHEDCGMMGQFTVT